MLDKPKHKKATSSNASNADQDDDDEEAVKCHVSEGNNEETTGQ